MKKYLFPLFLLVFLAGCATGQKSSKTPEPAPLPPAPIHKRHAAVYEFTNVTEFGGEDFAQKAAGAFGVGLGTTHHFSLIERQKLDVVLKEMELAQTGLIDEEKMVSVGKLVSADLICVGEIADVRYKKNTGSSMKKKFLSVFGITPSTDWTGTAEPNDYRVGWDVTMTVNIKIIDVEKGLIVFNRGFSGQAENVRLVESYTGPVYEPEKANAILGPVMEQVAREVVRTFR